MVFSVSVVFQSELVGEFWYQLDLLAQPPVLTTLPQSSCELGKYVDQAVHPTGQPHRRDTGAGHGQQQPSQLTLELDTSRPLIIAPHSSTQVPVRFRPSTIGARNHTAKISFTCSQLKHWSFQLCGEGLTPGRMEPLSVASPVGSHSSIILPFRNPTEHPALLHLTLTDEEPGQKRSSQSFICERKVFCIPLKQTQGVHVSAGASVDIPVVFAPDSMQLHQAWLLVQLEPLFILPRLDTALTTAQRDKSVQCVYVSTHACVCNRCFSVYRCVEVEKGRVCLVCWVYPIHGIPEAPPKPSHPAVIECEARGRVEERVEVLLTGCVPGSSVSNTDIPLSSAPSSVSNTDIPLSSAPSSVSNTDIPLSSAPSSVSNTDIPLSSAPSSVSNTDIPLSSAPSSVSNTDIPLSSAPSSVSNTDIPLSSAPSSVSNTDIPLSSAPSSVSNTDIPLSSAPSSVSNTDIPLSSAPSSVSNTDIPLSSAPSSVSNTDIPLSSAPSSVSNTDIPLSSAPSSVSNTDIPLSSAPSSVSNTDIPLSSAPSSVSNTDIPLSSAPSSVSNTDIPLSSAPSSVSNTDIPLSSAPSSVSNTDIPLSSAPSSVSNTDIPLSSAPSSVSNTDIPLSSAPSSVSNTDIPLSSAPLLSQQHRHTSQQCPLLSQQHRHTSQQCPLLSQQHRHTSQQCPLLGNLRDPHSGIVSLTVNLIFTPYKPRRCSAVLAVQCLTGGLWKFPISLISTEPQVDDVITINAAGLHKTSAVGFRLTSQTRYPEPFTAGFLPGGGSEFQVCPSSGELLPVGSAGTILTVSFTPSMYSKRHHATLLVQTADMQWTYEVKGTTPAYTPPHSASSNGNTSSR
ncbi:cilia- and flagella-associated protein 47 [Salmo salar]|uniref:Cilia- and flagella-associated protein 47 n=1 Tax=Salmo salar TaxID=8030 RepID=A0ABM3D1J5_SALSA|nr:cilia- and flagella-associated protein 47-like [Salmo salar]